MAWTAVVTGGSAGIGLSTADRLAEARWDIAIVARDRARLDEARDILLRRGRTVMVIGADVAEQVEAWVNNAKPTVVASADRITPAEYEWVTATTRLSQIYRTLAAFRQRRPRRKGIVVQVSSRPRHPPRTAPGRLLRGEGCRHWLHGRPGHVFDDKPPPTGLRDCIDGITMPFEHD